MTSRRDTVSVLLKHVERTRKKTENVRVEKRRKRSEKKSTNSTCVVTDFALENPECGQTETKVLHFHVRDWFREGITKFVSWSVTIPANDDWWKGKQGMLARRLLDAYGGDLVKKAVFYLCENWEQMIVDSNGRLSGLPTVELLWSSRERIFPNAEMGLAYVSPRKRDVLYSHQDLDEYREVEEDAVKHGW